MSRVEPYRNPLGKIEPGVWKFYCPCEYEDNRFGCSRLVNDSETNFGCERPIIEAKDKKCKLKHKLAPLIEAYEKWRKEQDAREFLASLEAKKQEAMKTLGLTPAQVNTAKSVPVTESSSKES